MFLVISNRDVGSSFLEAVFCIRMKWHFCADYQATIFFHEAVHVVIAPMFNDIFPGVVHVCHIIAPTAVCW
jgi:hypothetical protein